MKILVLADLDKACLSKLQARHEVMLWSSPWEPLPTHMVLGVHVIVLRSPYGLTEGFLENADNLRCIIRAGSGTDNISLPAALSGRVGIWTTPAASHSVAELAFGLLLSVARGIPQLHASLQSGLWLKSEVRGRELGGLCITIVGFGRIGQAAARIANGFDMRLLVVDRSPDKPDKKDVLATLPHVRVLELDAALPETDVLLLACPLNSETRQMIDAPILARLRPAAIVINVARGELIDDVALAEALVCGRISGVGIDVHSHEPPIGSPLVGLAGVVATPHVGAQTSAAYDRIGEEVLRLVATIDHTL